MNGMRLNKQCSGGNEKDRQIERTERENESKEECV